MSNHTAPATLIAGRLQRFLTADPTLDDAPDCPPPSGVLYLNTALFKHAKDNRPKQQLLSWRQVLEAFEHPYVIPGGASKEAAGGWTFGTYAEGATRGNEGLVSRTALALDFDHAVDREAVVGGLNALGVAYVVGTTASSTPDALRLRAIIPLTSSVSPELYRSAVASIMRRFAGPIDGASKAPAQMMFKPAVVSGREADYWWSHRPAPYLTAVELEAALAAEPAPVEARQKLQGAPVPSAYVQAALEGLRAELEAASTWDENRTDDRGRGWERMVADAAFKVAGLTVTPCTETGQVYLDPADAEAMFEDLVPEVMREAELDDGTLLAGKLAMKMHNPQPWAVAPILNTDEAFGLKGTPAPAPMLEGPGWGKQVLAPAVEGAQEAPASSWAPLDLGAIIDGVLDGTLQPEQPTLGRLPNGSALFYARRINQVFGDSNSGKSWAALLTAQQELQDGRHVLFLDFEDSPQNIVTRLMLHMGTGRDAMRRFHYVRPDSLLDAAGGAALASLLAEVQPTLAVIDSTGESLAVEGKNPNADEDVALWFRKLPRVLADAGCCVLLVDHLPKTSDGRFAIGSQRKRAAITGASYMQKMVDPFSQDRMGYSSLTVAKDRLGAHAEGEDVANLCITPPAFQNIGNRAYAEFSVPAPEAKPAARERITDDVLGYVRRNPGVAKSEVKEAVTGAPQTILQAIDQLVIDGRLKIEKVGRSHLLTVA